MTTREETSEEYRMRKGLPDANSRQVGGEHYQNSGEIQHWDIVNLFSLDYFQGQITKYLFRWKLKGGVQDLEKARHFLDKYIEDAKMNEVFLQAQKAGVLDPARGVHFEGEEPGPDYVNQD